MSELMAAVLPGLSGMPNIHPVLVHFPIALLTAFVVMEVCAVIFGGNGLRTAATWMLYLGTIGAISAVAAGMYAAATVEHSGEVHGILTRHAALGITTAVLAVVLSAARLLRREGPGVRGRAAYLIAGLLMVGVMMLGADLGGLMVYTHGVGVKAAVHAVTDGAGSAHTHEHHH